MPWFSTVRQIDSNPEGAFTRTGTRIQEQWRRVSWHKGFTCPQNINDLKVEIALSTHNIVPGWVSPKLPVVLSARTVFYQPSLTPFWFYFHPYWYFYLYSH